MDLPLEIIPVHWIRKPDKDQLESIKYALTIPSGDAKARYVRYENRAVRQPPVNPNSVSWHYEPLSIEQWNYWIIEYEGWGDEIQPLQHAADLLDNDLEFGFRFHGTKSGYDIVYNERANVFYSKISELEEPLPFTTEHVEELRTNYDLIKQVAQDYPHVAHSLHNYSDSKTLPARSGLIVIAYFSIIESLITHQPKLTESLDSLTHQIRTKIPLLSKRFHRPLPCSTHFPGEKDDKIWKVLYAYRNDIAHGREPDFKSKLRVLKNHTTVSSFLNDTVKLLLRFTLNDPVFIGDLQKC